MSYRVTKTYGHELGLSACFRQHRAHSHCRFLHGYALSFKLTFEADTLDSNNWVIDFGGLKDVKTFLFETFDHKLVVAEDDPRLDELTGLQGLGLVDALVLPAVGCEAFAQFVAEEVKLILRMKQGQDVAPLRKDVRLVEVEVREHGANSAIWLEDK